MNFKKYKWIFYIFTFLLITVVATVLSAMKPGDNIPDFSNAILLVGTVYAVLFLLYRLFKLFRDKREEKKIIKRAAEIFNNNQDPLKTKQSFIGVFKGRLNIKSFLIIAGIFLVLVLFYWFQIRPTQIKHNCSWVKHTDAAIPAKPVMSEEELKINGFIKDCEEESYRSIFSGQLLNEGCKRENKQTIEEYKTARLAVPAKDWWVQADENEYKFCLHDKGL